MRFSESKKRIPWASLLFVVVLGAVFVLGFCGMNPSQKTTQKAIVFEAD